MDTNSPGFAAQYLVLEILNDNKFKKLYCLLIKCQMYPNKSLQNSGRVQFDLAKKKPTANLHFPNFIFSFYFHFCK